MDGEMLGEMEPMAPAAQTTEVFRAQVLALICSSVTRPPAQLDDAVALELLRAIVMRTRALEAQNQVLVARVQQLRAALKAEL